MTTTVDSAALIERAMDAAKRQGASLGYVAALSDTMNALDTAGLEPVDALKVRAAVLGLAANMNRRVPEVIA